MFELLAGSGGCGAPAWVDSNENAGSVYSHHLGCKIESVGLISLALPSYNGFDAVQPSPAICFAKQAVPDHPDRAGNLII